MQINTMEEFEMLLHLGENNRHTRSTVLNECSSRSHTILEVRLEADSSTKHQTHLTFFDLAGSERFTDDQLRNKAQ